MDILFKTFDGKISAYQKLHKVTVTCKNPDAGAFSKTFRFLDANLARTFVACLEDWEDDPNSKERLMWDTGELGESDYYMEREYLESFTWTCDWVDWGKANLSAVYWTNPVVGLEVHPWDIRQW